MSLHYENKVQWGIQNIPIQKVFVIFMAIFTPYFDENEGVSPEKCLE
jgi:hypothetical protein